MDELLTPQQRAERHTPTTVERNWLARDQFLLSIPKDDAQEILKYATDNSHLVEAEDPMFIKIHMDVLQRMLVRARRRVYVEFAVWGAIVVGVAAAVSVFITTR